MSSALSSLSMLSLLAVVGHIHAGGVRVGDRDLERTPAHGSIRTPSAGLRLECEYFGAMRWRFIATPNQTLTSMKPAAIGIIFEVNDILMLFAGKTASEVETLQIKRAARSVMRHTPTSLRR
jgi:hypothetical protein